MDQMTLENHREVMRIARRNKYTLTYVAVVATAGLVIQIIEAVKG